MRQLTTIVVLALTLTASSAIGQELSADDPVILAMWEEGIERSSAGTLAQLLLDSLGPRLTGTPGSEAASRWVIDTYRSWGIEARAEPYGTWRGWRRGVTHVDLLEPRVRTLEATMLAWSPGTPGPVTGAVVALPLITSPDTPEAFFASTRGKFVLLTAPEPSCRPENSWERWATPESLERYRAERAAARAEWVDRARSTGVASLAELVRQLEGAGAAGILSSGWSRGWGVTKVFDAATEERAVHIDIGCEDYSLLWRLAGNGQGPILRVDADAEFLGEVPVVNTIGVLRGVERPSEYVVLSAHFDSWDSASGATDNGTGTIMMMEAMRILQRTYPRPKRTILVGHWNGEEQGLNGSRAFAADHPEIVAGLQALFNQDDGTGRVSTITMEGLSEAGAFFTRWLERIPEEIRSHVTLVDPGTPGRGGTDNASFTCAGAPAFGMNAVGWDYGTYTWHTNRDTFDKIVLDDLRNNATLTAMLAYLGSEEPEQLPRTRRVMPTDRGTGQPAAWPACRDPDRSFVR